MRRAFNLPAYSFSRPLTLLFDVNFAQLKTAKNS